MKTSNQIPGLEIIRTDANHPGFIELVRMLDAELAIRDGEDHSFYAPFNTIQSLSHAIVVKLDGLSVGCGALKKFDEGTAEIKRMYVVPEFRGRGIAGIILRELENIANDIGYSRCILETGLKQPEAIALYKKSGYVRIPNYAQYAGKENSVCFQKLLHNKNNHS